LRNASVEKRIRVALCGLPTFVDDVVSVLLRDAPDIAVVRRFALDDDLRDDFERAGVDVLICALPEAEMRSRWDAAIARTPLLAVLNLGAQSGDARMYALRPTEHVVKDLTSASLIRTLRERLRQ
jgi:DNA-binding transcriptional LysR family regulator